VGCEAHPASVGRAGHVEEIQLHLLGLAKGVYAGRPSARITTI